MIKRLLTLGDPQLYEISEQIFPEEAEDLKIWIDDLHDTLMEYRRIYGAGRAVAAPQIGVKKRLLYMNLGGTPYVFVNPIMEFPDDELYEVLDDCMSFPGLLVKVLRHKRAVIKYLDRNFEPKEMLLEGDLSELLQHEYDHLDGILATMRAKDNKSFILGSITRDFGE